MSSPPRTTPASPLDPPGPIAPRAVREPEDRCVRCGRPTPAGTSLCENDNPGGIKAPSSTQAHGTILVGVIAGFVLFAIAARFATGGAGPFAASVQGRATFADGSVSVVVQVTNHGTASSPAICRVTRDGTPRQEDVEFRTASIPPAETIEVERMLSSATGGAAYDPRRLTVRCT
jgi:hypothetical protein